MVEAPTTALPPRRMGKKICCIIVYLLLISISIIAQENYFIHKGLLNTIGTLGFGQMVNIPQSNIYLHTELEYFGSPKLSIKGETDFFVNASSDLNLFEYNHATFTGLSFHFPSNKIPCLDPYWNISPGIAYVKFQESFIPEDPKPIASFNPLLSTTIGVNYYAKKLVYFSTAVKYVGGKHLSNNTPLSLNEVRFMFGMGLHFF